MKLEDININRYAPYGVDAQFFDMYDGTGILLMNDRTNAARKLISALYIHHNYFDYVFGVFIYEEYVGIHVKKLITTEDADEHEYTCMLESVGYDYNGFFRNDGSDDDTIDAFESIWVTLSSECEESHCDELYSFALENGFDCCYMFDSGYPNVGFDGDTNHLVPIDFLHKGEISWQNSESKIHQLCEKYEIELKDYRLRECENCGKRFQSENLDDICPDCEHKPKCLCCNDIINKDDVIDNHANLCSFCWNKRLYPLLNPDFLDMATGEIALIQAIYSDGFRVHPKNRKYTPNEYNLTLFGYIAPKIVDKAPVLVDLWKELQ